MGTVALGSGTLAARADNIAEVAMGADQFSTLVTAVKAAGLAPALMGKGPLTVFAPTNAAFAKLPKSTLTMLLKPENKATLASILKYHVVPGRIRARNVMQLQSGTNVKSLNGESFAVRKMGGKVMLDAFGSKANVIKTDIRADNGVIHAIDTVIIPPSVMKAMQAGNGG
jgi:transforming growth factor-beta-induced protein